MPYLSTMLGTRIESMEGETIGRLEDVAIVPGAKFPAVRGIMARRGRFLKKRLFFIPWDAVEGLQSRKVTGSTPEIETGPPEDCILLSRDLLDKQIVDMEGYKIVRVTDIRMAWSGEELRVMGADVGLLAFLRRLGLGMLSDRLIKSYSQITDRIIPWNLVSPVDPMPYDLRLSVPYRKFLQIHPSDIADIIEQLDEDQRAKVMSLIEDPKAAEVLAQMLPEPRSSVVQAIDEQRLSELLDIMPPDEAADILGSLPREKAQLLLSLMGIKEAVMVRELLGYDPDTAGGRMTTEYVAIPGYYSVDRTIEFLREKGLEAETIYYNYVVDKDGHLIGVLSLRDLLSSPGDERVDGIMTRDVITVELEDDQELVADRLSRYNLLALPVVDESGVMRGIVTVDDAIDVLLEESSEDFSQLSGVVFEEEGAPLRGIFDSRRWAATMLTFLGGILGTALFGIFRTEFVIALAIVYFVPAALRASHDVSVWSLATAVRDMKIEGTRGGRNWKALVSEYGYALAAAVVISLLCFLIGTIWTESKWPAIAGSAGIFAAVALAGVLGVAIPLLVSRARPDPAVATGRLVRVAVTAASIIAFLVVSGAIVRAVG